jgi:hypothetical protein
MTVIDERPHKVTSRHLRRQAYLYIRQSTLRQVVENTESTERQYALRQRAVALGWPIEPSGRERSRPRAVGRVETIVFSDGKVSAIKIVESP